MSGYTAYEAGALNAWTPAQQAALRAMKAARQAEKDEEEIKLKEREERKRKERDGAADGSPDKVQAGKIVDDLLKRWNKPLYTFLDTFGPPHLAILILAGLHAAFLLYAPWYLLFLAPYFLIYILPGWSTLSAISGTARKDRSLWLVYWPVLAVVEYLEALVFKDRVRVLIWWPCIKCAACVLGYSLVGEHEGKPAYGVVSLVRPFLPDIPEWLKNEDKAKEKEKGKDKGKESDGKDRDKEKERERAKREQLKQQQAKQSK